VRRMVRAALVLVLVLAGACVPVVTHGPRVEPGFSLGVSAGVDAHAFAPQNDPLFLPVNWSWPVQYGWRAPGDTGVAVLVGVNVPGPAVIGTPLLVLSEGDVFVQLPSRPGAMQRGVGVLGSAYHVMPYVQLGRERSGAKGWYTTQGVVWLREIPQGDDFGREPGVAWMPALAAYDGGRFITATGYLQGGLGLQRERRCVQDGCEASLLPFWALGGGVTVQLHGARR